MDENPYSLTLCKWITFVGHFRIDFMLPEVSWAQDLCSWYGILLQKIIHLHHRWGLCISTEIQLVEVIPGHWNK